MLLIEPHHIVAFNTELGGDEKDLLELEKSINAIIDRTGYDGYVILSWTLSALTNFKDIRPLEWFRDIINKCSCAITKPSQIDLIYYASFSFLNITTSAKSTGNYLKKVLLDTKGVHDFLERDDNDFGVFHITRTRELKRHIAEYME